MTVERKLDCSYDQWSAEDMTTNLKLLEGHCQSSNNRDVASDFPIFVEDKTKIVDQEVSLILLSGYMDWIAEDAITCGCTDVDEPIAEFLLGDDVF